jgi:hypothetical protein
VDRDGVQKSVLRIIAEMIIRAGVDELCVVVCPGDEATYADAVGDLAGRLTFIPQPEPLGAGPGGSSRLFRGYQGVAFGRLAAFSWLRVHLLLEPPGCCP